MQDRMLPRPQASPHRINRAANRAYKKGLEIGPIKIGPKIRPEIGSEIKIGPKIRPGPWAQPMGRPHGPGPWGRGRGPSLVKATSQRNLHPEKMT